MLQVRFPAVESYHPQVHVHVTRLLQVWRTRVQATQNKTESPEHPDVLNFQVK